MLAIPDMSSAAAAGDKAFYSVFDALLPRPFGLALYAGIVAAQYLCGLATVTSASRVAFAFARDGGLPFSKQLARVSDRYKTPMVAIWSVGVLGSSSRLQPVYSTLTRVRALSVSRIRVPTFQRSAYGLRASMVRSTLPRLVSRLGWCHTGSFDHRRGVQPQTTSAVDLIGASGSPFWLLATNEGLQWPPKFLKREPDYLKEFIVRTRTAMKSWTGARAAAISVLGLCCWFCGCNDDSLNGDGAGGNNAGGGPEVPATGGAGSDDLARVALRVEPRADVVTRGSALTRVAIPLAGPIEAASDPARWSILRDGNALAGGQLLVFPAVSDSTQAGAAVWLFPQGSAGEEITVSFDGEVVFAGPLGAPASLGTVSVAPIIVPRPTARETTAPRRAPSRCAFARARGELK